MGQAPPGMAYHHHAPLSNSRQEEKQGAAAQQQQTASSLYGPYGYPQLSGMYPYQYMQSTWEGRWEGRWEDRWEDKWEGKWEGKWEDKWALGPPLGLLTSTCSMPPSSSSSRWECRATTEESKGRCQHDGPRRVTLLFFLASLSLSLSCSLFPSLSFPFAYDAYPHRGDRGQVCSKDFLLDYNSNK